MKIASFFVTGTTHPTFILTTYKNIFREQDRRRDEEDHRRAPFSIRRREARRRQE